MCLQRYLLYRSNIFKLTNSRMVVSLGHLLSASQNFFQLLNYPKKSFLSVLFQKMCLFLQTEIIYIKRGVGCVCTLTTLYIRR